MAANSRTAQVYETLRNEILDNLHPSGGKLAIDQLAERLGASPGAVREALSRLTSENLVVAQPQRGFIVAPVSAADLCDLTEVRVEIETRCLRRSIERGTLEWEGRLIGLWHQFKQTRPNGDRHAHDSWSRLHASFHDELIACCDSGWWLRLRQQLFLQAERYRRLILPRVRVARDIDAEHGAILDLTVARDADGACAALRDHLRLTARIILATKAPELFQANDHDAETTARHPLMEEIDP